MSTSKRGKAERFTNIGLFQIGKISEELIDGPTRG